MLATVVVLSLVFVAFWKSLIRFVVAGLLVILVLGGIQAARAIGAIVPVTPQQCSTTGQTPGSPGC